jgi:shikimate kinase
MSDPVVILIGPPGAGKSTAGPMVAARLNVGFLDTDDEIASAFRAMERAVVQRALRYHGVVALGSGAVLDEQTRQLLAGHRTIYLETGFAEVAKRVGLNKPRVPVPGNPRGLLRSMLAERTPLYEGLAVVTIPTDDLDPAQVVDKIVFAQRHEMSGR